MINVDNTQIKILLVDDTDVNLELAGKILQNENYDLYIADNGYTATELTEKTDFDLILLDIMMPEIDGFETYQRILENDKNKAIPVIFLTAKVDIESIVKGFALGAVDYIRKPFNELELLARVKTHVTLKKTQEALEQKNMSLQNAYERLEIVANTDPLTKLLNRRETIKRMEYEQLRYERNQRTFCIVLADIDFFKKVNDTYGHNYGDYILKAIADLFQSNTRHQDSVSRWGGEEFLLLLPETDIESAARVAEKLRRLIEETVFSDGTTQTKITMTFGVAAYNYDESLENVISKADSALYAGKQKSRNCVMTYERN